MILMVAFVLVKSFCLCAKSKNVRLKNKTLVFAKVVFKLNFMSFEHKVAKCPVSARASRTLCLIGLFHKGPKFSHLLTVNCCKYSRLHSTHHRSDKTTVSDQSHYLSTNHRPPHVHQ